MKKLLSIFILSLGLFLNLQSQTSWATATATNQIKQLKSLDTINQSLRNQYNFVDNYDWATGVKQDAQIEYDKVKYINVTTTITVNTSTNYTAIIGNECSTNTLASAPCFSVAIPPVFISYDTWQIKNIILSNSLWEGLGFMFFANSVTASPNNSLTAANYSIQSQCIGYATVSGSYSGMNGYVGQYASITATPLQINIQNNTIFFKCAYITARVFTPANASWVVTFVLERT